MKDTLKYYSKIYEPLFKKNYTKSSNRSSPLLSRFETYCKQNYVKIDKVIDVGCAWGKALKYWRNKGCQIYGVDISKIVVDHCRKEGFDCRLSSATNLSVFPDKIFDVYMASDVYEHLREDDLEDAINEAKRVTKKYLLIRPHPKIDKRKILHLTVWSLSKWKHFFRDHGLDIIKIDDKFTHKNCFVMGIGGQK